MALTDTFVKNVKHTGAPAGDKHTDGGNMYLLVNAAGKYWRLNYRFDSKQKTLALGVYPDVPLLKARQRRDKARELLADGIDPGIAKQQAKQAQAAVLANTFEAVARDWLVKTAADRMAGTQGKVTTWLQKDVFPYIGNKPISTIGGRDVLAACHPKRGSEAFISLALLEQFEGVLVHDGWLPYKALQCQHALCNQHHLRELTYLFEEQKQAWAGDMIELLTHANH